MTVIGNERVDDDGRGAAAREADATDVLPNSAVAQKIMGSMQS